MHLVGYLYEDYHDTWSLEHNVGRNLRCFMHILVQFLVWNVEVASKLMPQIAWQYL